MRSPPRTPPLKKKKGTMWRYMGRVDNDFADVTLACVDDQQVEAPKLFLAGQVLFNRLFHSHHHINIIVKKQARGSSWALVV